LKRGWGVGESEEHYHWFKKAFVGDEGCLPFISFFDPYIVVSPTYVEFGVDGASIQSVNEFGYKGKGVNIAYGPLIDWSIVLYWLKFPILLFDEEETCFVGTL
jgi:hypothetical protein